jgi:RNA-binding protein YlmH
MGQGIKREKLGDIIILGQDSKSSTVQGSGQGSTHEPGASAGKPATRGAQIIVASELADYLAENFTQVGAANISTKKVPISNLRTSEIRTQELSITVSSPRLDNVISGVFNISRTAAKDAITRGLVFVSGVEVNKPDHSLKGGEKLVLRGSGKAIYHGPTGTSRKSKTYITITKYI